MLLPASILLLTLLTLPLLRVDVTVCAGGWHVLTTDMTIFEHRKETICMTPDQKSAC